MTPESINALAAQLWAARRGGTKIAFPDGLASEKDAYAIQDALIASAESQPAGWKAGATGDGAPAALGLSGPFSGPLWDGDVYRPAGGEPRLVPLGGLDDGTAKVEIETAFLFGRTPRSSAREDLLQSVEGAAIAFEILGNRFDSLPQPPGLAFVADHAANAAIVLGEWRADWRDMDLSATRAVLSVDGREAAAGEGRAVMGNPVEALCWLAGHLAQRGYGFSEGQIVMSGAIAPMTAAPAGVDIKAELTGFDPIAIRIGKRSP